MLVLPSSFNSFVRPVRFHLFMRLRRDIPPISPLLNCLPPTGYWLLLTVTATVCLSFLLVCLCLFVCLSAISKLNVQTMARELGLQQRDRK